MNRFAADVLGCEVPLLMAPLAHLASPSLIANVTEAGGIGTFPLHRLKPNQTSDQLSQIRSRTNGPIMVAYTGEWERDENLDVLLQHNVNLAMVFWWNGPRLIHRLQAHGIKVGWQVGTDEQLSDAMNRNADFIIAQGLHAGGPVRSPYPLDELLGMIKHRTTTPVIATGGINTPEQATSYVPELAAGIMLGTRFCATTEANNSDDDKQLLCEASDTSVTLDTTLRGDWPCAFRRRLTSGGNQDIPERYANSNVGQISSILSATEVVRAFATVLNQ